MSDKHDSDQENRKDFEQALHSVRPRSANLDWSLIDFAALNAEASRREKLRSFDTYRDRAAWLPIAAASLVGVLIGSGTTAVLMNRAASNVIQRNDLPQQPPSSVNRDIDDKMSSVQGLAQNNPISNRPATAIGARLLSSDQTERVASSVELRDSDFRSADIGPAGTLGGDTKSRPTSRWQLTQQLMSEAFDGT